MSSSMALCEIEGCKRKSTNNVLVTGIYLKDRTNKQVCFQCYVAYNLGNRNARCSIARTILRQEGLD